MRLTLVAALSGGLMIGCDDNPAPEDGGTDPTDGGTDPVDGGGDDPDGGGEDCPTEGVTISGEITADTTWSCPLYVLDGRIFVVNDATLTIDAGVEIIGEPGVDGGSALIVTRGAQLVANGTAAEPIVFTSGSPVGERITGDWAGVAMLGASTINSGSCVDDGDTGTPECDAPGFFEDRVEGIDVADDRGRYGGSDEASSCGSLQYVRIEFAGAELSPDNELNGLTLAGCGSGTTLSHIQIHRGKDDGIEFFGGTASVDHLIVSGPSDDGFDCDNGWRGNAQFVVVHQFAGIGDNAIECDNLGSDEDAEPRTNPTFSNFTLVGAGEGRVAVLREGFRADIDNAVVVNFDAPVDLRAEQVDLSTEWPAELSWENSYFFNTGAWPAETGADDDDMGFDEEAAFTDAARNNDFSTDPMLGDTSITAPNYMPGVALSGVAPTFGDTTADYAGAFEMGGDNWAEGWTAYPEN